MNEAASTRTRAAAERKSLPETEAAFSADAYK
jgi:hypothetical protein